MYSWLWVFIPALALVLALAYLVGYKHGSRDVFVLEARRWRTARDESRRVEKELGLK